MTAGETPNSRASFLATLAELTVLPRVDPGRHDSHASDGAESPFFSPCGYPDAYSLNHLIGDDSTNQQATSAIRPRYQELEEGAREDFFLVPVMRAVPGQKMLAPNETLHCTIFAEVVGGNPVIDRTKALEVARAFDSNNPQRPGSGIYSQVRAVFGSEWNQNPPGGNDGDEKIVIFFFSSQTLGQGLFGFVSPADSNPNGGSSSNKGEIIYINADKSPYQTLATLSHEFQHVINQNQKVNQQGANPTNAQEENLTVNEGLAELSEEVCGYTLETGNELLALVINNYLEKPQDHEFFNFFQGGLSYGQGYLFFRFVREQYGDEVIRRLSTDTRTGRPNLDAHLPGGFAEVFRRWVIANYATNLGDSVPSIYRYPSGLRTNGTYPAGTLVGVKTFPMAANRDTSSASLRPWSASYLTIENKTGSGLRATITPADSSPYGLLFEQTEGDFTQFND